MLGFDVGDTDETRSRASGKGGTAAESIQLRPKNRRREGVIRLIRGGTGEKIIHIGLFCYYRKWFYALYGEGEATAIN